MNNKRLFVAGIPWSIDDQKLGDLFATYGEVFSAKVIMDRDSGRSKGFGFVEFKNEADAKAALEGMNGADVEGRKLVVNIAKPQAGR